MPLLDSDPANIQNPPNIKPKNILYDILYYKNHLNQVAIKLLKRIPREEQIQRKLKAGVQWRSTKKFPDFNSQKHNVMARAVMACFHGSSWLIDTKQNDRFDYTIIQGTEKDPEIIGGILKPGVLEDPEFIVYRDRSVKFELNRDEELLKRKTNLTQTVKKISSSASYRYKVAAAHIGGLKNPSKIPEDELNDVVDMLIMSDVVVLPSVEKWFSVHCQDISTIQTAIQTLDEPFQIARDEDFESVCSAVRMSSV